MLSNVVKRYMPLLEKAIKYIMHVIANRFEYGRFADSSVGRKMTIDLAKRVEILVWSIIISILLKYRSLYKCCALI